MTPTPEEIPSSSPCPCPARLSGTPRSAVSAEPWKSHTIFGWSSSASQTTFSGSWPFHSSYRWPHISWSLRSSRRTKNLFCSLATFQRAFWSPKNVTHNLVCISIFQHIFSKAQVASNKSAHNFQHHSSIIHWNVSKTSMSRFWKLTPQTKCIVPCDRVWKTVSENGVRICVHFC